MLYCKQFNFANKNDSLTQVYELIPARVKVLDVGCATGSLAQALHNDKECQVVGVEYNPRSVAVCQKLNVFARVIQYDMNNFTIADFAEYKGFFDYIVCADVLEHLLQPERILAELKLLLKKDGKLVISLPNVAHASIKANLLFNDFTYTDMGILDKTHLHFYTYKSIAQLLVKCGLKVVKASAVILPDDGWQPHKINELPQDIADFIVKDKHSHIMQYVMLCSQEKAALETNITALDTLSRKELRPTIVSRIKRIIMLKMPKLINYIEKLKK